MNHGQHFSDAGEVRAKSFCGRGDTDAVTLPVILIGPVNAGKSTIGALLAERLGVGRASLDELCFDYFTEAGYNPEVAREHFERGGQAGAEEYMVRFYPHAVDRILAGYPETVIDFGAGHTVYDDPEQLGRVKRALAPYPNIVLLLPSPDSNESIRILNGRESNPYPEVVALNEYFVRHHSNRRLATIEIYTERKTPHETCDEIIKRLN